ncbi:MAG: hypothetical protein R2716_11155 [Microthrixaceae bacterium]
MLKFAPPVICRSGRIVTLGAVMSTSTKAVMPRCFGRLGSVLQMISPIWDR